MADLRRGDRVRISDAGKRAHIQWHKGGNVKIGTLKGIYGGSAAVLWDGNKTYSYIAAAFIEAAP